MYFFLVKDRIIMEKRKEFKLGMRVVFDCIFQYLKNLQKVLEGIYQIIFGSNIILEKVEGKGDDRGRQKERKFKEEREDKEEKRRKNKIVMYQ